MVIRWNRKDNDTPNYVWKMDWGGVIVPTTYKPLAMTFPTTELAQKWVDEHFAEPHRFTIEPN